MFLVRPSFVHCRECLRLEVLQRWRVCSLSVACLYATALKRIRFRILVGGSTFWDECDGVMMVHLRWSRLRLRSLWAAQSSPSDICMWKKDWNWGRRSESLSIISSNSSGKHSRFLQSPNCNLFMLCTVEINPFRISGTNSDSPLWFSHC